jgi:hypothetical protein
MHEAPWITLWTNVDRASVDFTEVWWRISHNVAGESATDQAGEQPFAAISGSTSREKQPKK